VERRQDGLRGCPTKTECLRLDAPKAEEPFYDRFHRLYTVSRGRVLRRPMTCQVYEEPPQQLIFILLETIDY
jgi:hypothetical protein